MSCQNPKVEKSERDEWYPWVQYLTQELRDLGQHRGHAVKGRMVRGFPSSPIARRNLCHFWEKIKPKRINIKVPGHSKCPFKALRRGPQLTHKKANMYIQIPSKNPLSTQQTRHYLCNLLSKPMGSQIDSKGEIVWSIRE